jgi:type IV secretory pathway TraG/TraD family ATPase VirD4
MSYTRGQETFWNSLIITCQNLARLFWACILFAIVSFSVSFYFMTPPSLWKYVGEGFAWLKSILFNEGIFVAFSRFSDFFAYQQSIFALHTSQALKSLVVAGIFSSIGYAILVIYFNKRGLQLSKDEHVSGAKLITPKEFTKAANKLIKNQLAEIKKDTNGKIAPETTQKFNRTPFACTADKIEISADLLSTHVAAIGATGTGKTTVIQHRIEHAKLSGHKGIVLDINGELYSKVGGKDDVILSLFDTRCSYWDYQYESYQNLAVSPMEIAEYLVPKENVDDSVWWKAPRIILEDLLTQCNSTAALWELIQNPSADLIQYLYSGLAKKAAGKPDSRTAYSMIIKTILDCRYFGFLNYWPNNSGSNEPFSILEWTQNSDPRWIFIVAHEKDITLMQPLIRLWFNIAIHGLAERKPYNDLPPIAVIIDELRSVGVLEKLPEAINRLRKYGGQCFFGYQSDSQLTQLYGPNDAASLNAGFGTKFVFNIANEKEAETAANAFGQQEIKRKSFSSTYGVTAHGDRETLGEQLVSKPVVTATDISKLPNGHFYIKARAVDPVKTRIKYKYRPKLFPLHSECSEYPKDVGSMKLDEESIKQELISADPEFDFLTEE